MHFPWFYVKANFLSHTAWRVKGKLRQIQGRALRSLGIQKRQWAESLPDEIAFWENALREGGRAWDPKELQKRLNPDLELQDDLKALIDAPPQSVVRILDVGAGPLTTLGKRWEGRQLQIVAVDPLAEKYDALLDSLSICPPVKTVFGRGESLLQRFKENEFDLAYASNSLDHSEDPIDTIRQMLAVVKDLHFVYLWHFANAGLAANYEGLHQWNFDIEGDDFVLKGARRTFSLAAEFKAQAELQAEATTGYGNKVVIAKLKKLTA